jgi:hypothetical protein
MGGEFQKLKVKSTAKPWSLISMWKTSTKMFQQVDYLLRVWVKKVEIFVTSFKDDPIGPICTFLGYEISCLSLVIGHKVQ